MHYIHKYLDLNDRFATFLDGAVDAAFWSTQVDNGDDLPQPAQDFPVTDEELTILRGTIAHHTRDWFIAHLADITRAADALGHYSRIGNDFWLASQGYGEGFSDRDLGPLGDRLADSCDGYEQMLDLYVEDGHIRVDPYNVTTFSDALGA